MNIGCCGQISYFNVFFFLINIILMCFVWMIYEFG